MRSFARTLLVAASIGGMLVPAPLRAQESSPFDPAVVSYRTGVAPADEYFGRLKMSILGIRNHLNDLDRKLNDYSSSPEDVYSFACFVEDAMRDWASKYPRDPWLPGDYYQLAGIYSRIDTPSGRHARIRTLHWLRSHYPYSAYAREAADDYDYDSYGTYASDDEGE